MKTKIRTTLIICALGFMGLTANAANYRNEINSMNLSNSGLNAYFLNEDAEATIDFRVEAQMVSKWVADNEEARAIQKLIDKGLFFNPESLEVVQPANASNLVNENESRKEANSVTKTIADNEEAKAMRKLAEEGKLAEIW